jgi:diguanylate cyclase (GGDEF)-like protein
LSRKRKTVRRDTERRKALEDEAAREVTEILREERGEVAGEVIEIAARDTERSPEQQELLDREKSRRESFYSDLIYSLCNVRYDEPEARLLWVNLLAHKTEMSDHLGRNVGIRVAALDYFKNIVGLLDEVKIVGGAEFVETARLAVTDGLTGLFNHRYFQNRLERSLGLTRELGQSLGLLMIDIDYFKQYNDLNGHIAGDVALREMAALLRGCVKRGDTVARYGGEEFAVVLFDTDEPGAVKVAERLRGEVQRIDFPNEQVLPGGHLTISVGLAMFPRDAGDRPGLIARADRALYAAKRGGRNRVCWGAAGEAVAPRLGVDQVGVTWEGRGQGAPARRTGRLLGISPRGAALVTGGAPAEGEAVALTLTGDFPGGRLVVPARVVWRQEIPEGGEVAGLAFEPGEPALERELARLAPGPEAPSAQPAGR